MPKLRAFGLCVLVAISAVLTACEQKPQVTPGPEVKASSTELVSRPAEPASPSPKTAATAPELTTQCQTALHVLSTCAFETSCNADMTMYLPSAARDQLVALTKTPGFKAEAFDKYCERTCNTKSPEVDLASFAREVCGEISGGAPAQVGTGASSVRPADKPVAMGGLKSLQGFASQQIDDRTVRVGVSPGASLETAYDFKFVDGQLDRVEYWIGC